MSTFMMQFVSILLEFHGFHSKTAFKAFSCQVMTTEDVFKNLPFKSVTMRNMEKKAMCAFLWTGYVSKQTKRKDWMENNLTTMSVKHRKFLISNFKQLKSQNQLSPNPPAAPAATASQQTPANIAVSDGKGLRDIRELGIGKDSYVKYVPMSFEQLSVGQKVQVNYKGSARLYDATIAKIHPSRFCIDLKYNDGSGDVWNNVIWFLPFERTDDMMTISSISDTEVVITDGSVTKTIPMSKWINHIIPFQVQIPLDSRTNNLAIMEDGVSYKILYSYAMNCPSVDYTVGSHSYKLSWDSKNGKLLRTGTQRNVSTNTGRHINLIPCQKPKPVKCFLDSKKFPLVKVSDMATEYANMVTRLDISESKLRIYDLNSELKHKEMVDFVRSREGKRGNALDSQVLAHGTDVSVIKKMIQHDTGFQKAKTKNGKVYGDGIYLTSDSSYACEYAPADKQGRRVILLCDVFVGNRMKTGSRTSMLKPGFRCGGNGTDIYMKPWVYASSDIGFICCEY